MRRLHLFELEDQAWLPSLIRDAGTAYLELAARVTGQTDALAPVVTRAIQRSGTKRIVDLGSGGSGPLPAAVAASAETLGEPVEVLLTDLYPNLDAFARAERSYDFVHAVREPIDAMDVPKELDGLRTLFNAFHHFRPEQARRILRDAAEARQPIAVFEVVARHPLAILGILFAPIATLFAVPFLRPFRWGWIPFTYLLPVIPLFVLWDGLVSCLRCYTTDELRDMTKDLGGSEYVWETGSIDLPGAPFDGTWLLGTPRGRDAASSEPRTESRR
jgi:hypothetical protein